MSLGEEIFPLGGDNDWFRIHFTENPGMAFGLKLGGSWGKILLSSFRIVAVSFMGYYLSILIKKKASLGLIVSIAFILAGALGNILDSAFYGFLFDKGTTLNSQTGFWNGYYGIAEYGGNYAGFLQGCVVDMLYFPMFDGYFPDWLPFWGGEPFSFFRPVFNLADSSITLGVFMIIAFQRRFFKDELENEGNQKDEVETIDTRVEEELDQNGMELTKPVDENL
jgi:signal peptidase II